ncbi:glycerol-3-phosphate dehydrogenase [Fictibacillus macauensis ZFHKF-1]|uniref:Aerobic glycerol-3-phosphate dehydrogenase n=1 Tax=Fictibacillus macauensis ZFHKF-1 TaxID=1196324 RepID=I8UA40_9BACL|nr:FAD-dependent oxidoreductase [Fictibacillus macauensis]EIT83815.1 glycerol-3-phosphate dehydrogenase [Fictibacillus macauensis ZFHKF-1]
MGQIFSSNKREQYIQDMKNSDLDLLVIGGGVTGAGILLDASTRGMKAAVLEMQDFAGGTSSRSTKLVHGGLRYLKQFEVGLVAEVGKERAIVYENAPHVTTPEWMLLPFYKKGTFGKFSTSIGLKVYDFLAGVKRSERRTMFDRQTTLDREPLLKKQDLLGGGYYVEYKTDDARLTLENMKEAVSRGGKAVNYIKVVDFIYDNNGKILGVKAVDTISGKEHEIHAKKIVNAAGPWVDELRDIDKSKKGKRIHHTKGIHVVIDQKDFPLRQAVYFDTPDGRMVFAIPRDGKAYVGTTDTDYKGDLKNPRVTKEDLDYVIKSINFMFPEVDITEEQVESTWCGLRPLIHEDGKDPSEISRKDEVFFSPSGLITIAGGKLTGYRKMAEKISNIVAEHLEKEIGIKYDSSNTKHLILSGGNVGGSSQFPDYIRTKTTEGMKHGLTKEQAEQLVRKYGSNVDQLFAIVDQGKEEAQANGLALDVYATLVYTMDEEMATTPSDYFIRRTSAMYFNIGYVYEWKEKVIAFMAKYLNWTPEETKEHTEELERQISYSTEFI